MRMERKETVIEGGMVVSSYKYLGTIVSILNTGCFGTSQFKRDSVYRYKNYIKCKRLSEVTKTVIRLMIVYTVKRGASKVQKSI